jgi:tetratricopeptide (TPR) repeat protein
MRPNARPWPSTRSDWIAAGLLAAAAFAVFAPSIGYDFVNVDDPAYVSENPHVLSGLNATNVRWAFGTFHTGYWQPATWLSLQLDASLWPTSSGGGRAWGFHLDNVLLHAANAALLFLVLRALAVAPGTSAAVALLFAVHPLRVESVAWVTERKDVLSTLFGLLALGAYAGYAAAPSARRYLPVALALALSLMAKPMLVTLPCLLLVLDWWPLGRWRAHGAWPLVREKLPLFAVAAAGAAIAYRAQAAGGATRDSDFFPLGMRLENAAVSYVAYLVKTAWPVDLAVFYPHPGPSLSAASVTGAAALLAAVTAAAVALRRRAPYFLAGWLGYVGTLVPVIGLVQVGDHAMADRFSYFPQIGILLALCGGVADLARARGRYAAAALAMSAALALAVLARWQLTAWRDSVSLWERALAVTGDNPRALMSLGRALDERQRPQDAARCYDEAVRMAPYSVPGHAALGDLLVRLDRPDEAVRHLREACRLDPENPEARARLGEAYARQGKLDLAAAEFAEYLRLLPSSVRGYVALGNVYLRQGDAPEAARRAAECFARAVHAEPDSTAALQGLGLALCRLGRKAEGVAQLRAAVRYEPDSPQAHALLGRALANCGDFDRAGDELAEAARLDPGEAEVWFDLGRVRERQGRTEDAVRCRRRAAELGPRPGAGGRPASPGPNPP